MKNIFFFLAVMTAVFFSSCGNSSVPQVPETYCHTELVYHPLTTAVVAVPYRVQRGDEIGDIVRMHKTDPNQTGGHFLDYNLEMFLADNPEVVASTKRSIRKDKCDPNKIDTVFYQAWNLKENDLVYLRIPARIDTVDTAGPNVVWFTPEKVSRIRQVTERIEIQKAGLKPKPATEVYKNLCPSDVVTDDTEPVYVNSNGGNPWPYWPWVIIGLLMILGFIVLYNRIGNQHDQTRSFVNGAEMTTREHVTYQGHQTRQHVSDEHATTRSGLSEVASAIQEQTTAANNQVAETKQTNDLLQKILEQGGLSGRRSSKSKPPSSSSSSSKS